MENTNKENEELKEKVIFVLNYWFHIDEKDIDTLQELTEKDLKAITTYLFRLGTCLLYTSDAADDAVIV